MLLYLFFAGIATGIKDYPIKYKCPNLSIHLVIAQVENDNLDWLNNHPFHCYTNSLSSSYDIISGNYLDFIVKNYQNLPALSVFLPSWCYSLTSTRHTLTWTLHLLRNVDKNPITTFPSLKLPHSLLDDGLSLPSWFSDTLNISTGIVSMWGIFAASKKDILDYPKSFYINMLNSLTSESIAYSQSLDLLWGAVFPNGKFVGVTRSSIYQFQKQHDQDGVTILMHDLVKPDNSLNQKIQPIPNQGIALTFVSILCSILVILSD